MASITAKSAAATLPPQCKRQLRMIRHQRLLTEQGKIVDLIETKQFNIEKIIDNLFTSKNFHRTAIYSLCPPFLSSPFRGVLPFAYARPANSSKPCPLFTSALRQSSTDTNIFELFMNRRIEFYPRQKAMQFANIIKTAVIINIPF